MPSLPPTPRRLRERRRRERKKFGNWATKRRQKFQKCCKLRAFQDLANRTGSRMVAFFHVFHQNWSTVISRAPSARAKKVWNRDDKTWSKTFKNAVKLRAFRGCANRTSSQTVVFCRASRQNNPRCIASAKGAREENLGSTQRYLAKSLKLDVKLRAF